MYNTHFVIFLRIRTLNNNVLIEHSKIYLFNVEKALYRTEIVFRIFILHNFSTEINQNKITVQ